MAERQQTPRKKRNEGQKASAKKYEDNNGVMPAHQLPELRSPTRRAAMTPVMRIAIEAFIKAGGGRRKAAEFVGISLERLVAEEKKSEKFAQRLASAQATSYKTHLANVSGAGEDDWRASAWLLERMFPDEFGPPTRRVEAVIETREAGGDDTAELIHRLHAVLGVSPAPPANTIETLSVESEEQPPDAPPAD